MASTHLDRAAVEKLFRVRRRREAEGLRRKSTTAHRTAWTDFEASVYAVENKAVAASLGINRAGQVR